MLLPQAISLLPAGRYAVAVSGGADSIALLQLLFDRMQMERDLHLHVVHLNHETRGGDSDDDAQFVEEFAKTRSLPVTISRLSGVLPLLPDHSSNPSALFRQARLALFRQVCKTHQLDGVVVAHHLDDQAETILLRLLQSAEPLGLCGMNAITEIQGLRIFRPLLSVSRQSLRDFLTQNQIHWREDASNQSPKYHRNEIRQWLILHPEFTQQLIPLSTICRRWKNFLDSHSPELSQRFAASDLIRLPRPLAIHSARRWLHARGIEDRRVSQDVIARLIDMATDQATSPKQDFPGQISIRRKQGMIFADSCFE